ncbi:MAG: hypothetical protein ACYC7E_14445 [Armatimonadota bacterium]
MARTLVSLCLLLATGLLASAAGLTYVSADSSHALFSTPVSVNGFQAFSKPQPNSGTVHSRAMVATIRNAPSTIKVALDCTQTNGTRFDVIRFDFSGQGRFNAEQALPLNYPPRSSNSAAFGPQTLQYTNDGKSIMMSIRGYYNFSEKSFNLIIYLGCAAQATGIFKEKIYPVRVLDGNNNLRFGDPFRNTQHPTRGIVPGRGDTIQIDPTNSNFSNVAKIIRTGYGSPILVDGAWYEVALRPDGTDIVVRPYEGQRGTLRLPRAPWNAQLINTQYLLSLASDAREITIPTGQYQVYMYGEEIKAIGQAPVLLTFMYGSGAEKPTTIEVVPNMVRDAALGSPVNAAVNVKKNGGEAILSLGLSDFFGNPITSVSSSRGGVLPPKVSFEVVKSQGAKVFTSTFEAGQSGYGTRSWRAPQAGEYTVRVFGIANTSVPITPKETRFTMP